MGRKQLFINFNKMQPLLNASKSWETIPGGSLRTIYNTYKKLIKFSNSNWRAKN